MVAMIHGLKRISIATQAGLLMVLMLISTIGVLFFWATENSITAEVRHAQTVADMADSFRTIASEHGGFYVRRNSTEDVSKVGRYLAEYKSEPSSDGNQYVFHQKNPFLAVADYSQAVQSSASAAKFRITSDNYMNPANSPDSFDRESIQMMRESGARQTWQVVGTQMRFARALVADMSCMRCHSSPESAPTSVSSKYRGLPGGAKGGGYGYKVGDVVGITSVTVPHATPLAMLASQSVWFWVSAAVVLGLMVLSYWLALVGVVAPLRKLSEFTHAISSASDAKELAGLKVPRFDKDERTSQNEIHLESFALKTLHQAMWSAMIHIGQGSGKPTVPKK